MLEFKLVDRTQELVDATARLFEKYPQEGRSPIFLASTSFDLLKVLHEKLPNQPLVAIVDSEELLEEALALPITVLALDNKLVTRERARALHKKEIALWAFTVNFPGPANELVQLGADGIISDNPRTIQNSIQR